MMAIQTSTTILFHETVRAVCEIWLRLGCTAYGTSDAKRKCWFRGIILSYMD